MPRTLPLIATPLLLFGILVLGSSSASADEWLPIGPAELTMTSEPKDPSASAICLYRQEDIDDAIGTLKVYMRVKILSEAGRNNANIEIDYNQSSERFRYIRARTVQPDGSIVNFDGSVYDTPVKVGHDADLYAKTFTLQGAQVGSIIEYQYLRETRKHDLRYQVRWILNQDLFTKLEKFSLLPATVGTLKVTLPAGLPAGTAPPKFDDKRLVLEARDVPAYIAEEQMPPDNAVRSRVDFAYVGGKFAHMSAPEFWTYIGKAEHQHIEFFVDRPHAMQKALRQIVSAGDSAQTRLQKIYARVQRFHDSSDAWPEFQRARRDDASAARDVADLWSSGHAGARQIPWLFLALARAAGFSADPVLASSRKTFFFDRNDMNPDQLDSNLVVVNLDGRDLFLDPGNPYAPFGQLPWYDTAVPALRLNPQGGTWIETPPPEPEGAWIERKASLALGPDGGLSGRLAISFVGSEATWRRMAERGADGPARRKFLEDEVRASIPAVSEVRLTNEPAWESAEAALQAEFEVKIDAWADVSGPRMLLPVEVFGGEERRLFEHASRVQPVYFDFPFMRRDDVSVTLPPGIRASFIPQQQRLARDAMSYTLTIESTGGGLHLRRDLSIDRTLIRVAEYGPLRSFYQLVRAGDEQYVVLSGGADAGAG